MLLPWMLALLAPVLLTGPSGSLDLSTLNPSQRATFAAISAEEFCSCESALTLAGCLELRPQCRTAQHLGNVVKRGVEAGVTRDEMLALLAQRVSGPFCGTPSALNVDGAPSEGSDKAPITVVEFADFRCAHCRKVAPEVHRIIDALGEKVRFVFVPFPLRDHPESVAAARAVLAAHKQGKFRKMHDLLMHEDLKHYDLKHLRPLARRAGLNVKRFNKDFRQASLGDDIQRLKKAGLAAGVEATPSFFVNGRPFTWDPLLFTLNDRLHMELDRHQGNCQ